MHSFSTSSSEYTYWFEDNTLKYYSRIFVPALVKQVIITLPFFMVSRLEFSKRENRIFLLLVVGACLDLVILSTFPLYVITEIL